MDKTFNNSGQAFLEYILMLLFVAGIFSFVYRNFGNELRIEGRLIQTINGKFRYTYRHAFDGNKEETYPPSYNQAEHDSYRSSDASGTRFFGPAQRYPTQ